jgi:hypothetical protein
MFKTLTGLVVGTAMAFVPVATTHAAVSANAFVSPSGGTYTTGNTFSVVIYEDSGDNDVDSASAKLTYDAGKLEATKIEPGDFTTCIGSPSASGGNISTSDCTILGAKKRGQQRLATVTFKAVAEGTAAVNFSSAKVVNNGVDLPVTTANGSFTVAAPATGGMGGGSTTTGSSSSSSSSSSAANKVATTGTTGSTTPVATDNTATDAASDTKADTSKDDTKKADTTKADTAKSADGKNTASKSRNWWPMVIILLVAVTAAAYAYRNRGTATPVEEAEEPKAKETKKPVSAAVEAATASAAVKRAGADKSAQSKPQQQGANRNKKNGNRRPSNERTR